MKGRVVSNKLEKTATVLVTRTAMHPLYKKTYVASKKYLAQDDLGVKMGDIVEIEKIKPVSKKKHWKVIKVVGRSLEEIVKEHLQEDAAEVISEVMPVEKVEETVIEETKEPKEKTEKKETKKKGKSISSK